MTRRGPTPQGIRREDYATEADYQKARKAKNNQAHYAAKYDDRIAYNKEWRKRNPEMAVAHRKTTNQRRRDAVITLFGGKCKKCGFDDPRALQLDHVHGAKEPRGHPMRNGSRLYDALLKGERDTEEYQLLCANCNWIKRVEEDECRKNRKISTRWLTSTESCSSFLKPLRSTNDTREQKEVSRSRHETRCSSGMIISVNPAEPEVREDCSSTTSSTARKAVRTTRTT
jgi:hypothetical protein